MNENETKVSINRSTHKRLKEFCEAAGLKLRYTADRFINECLDKYWESTALEKQPQLFQAEVNEID